MRRATAAVCHRCGRGSSTSRHSRHLLAPPSSSLATLSSRAPLHRTSPVPSPRLRLSASLAPCPARSFSSFSAALEEWNSFNKAGLQYLDEGRFQEAEALFISALRTSQVLLRDGSSTSSVPLYLAMSNLSVAQRHQGKLSESRGNAQAALDAVKALKQQVGLDVLAHMQRELGLVYELQGDWTQAQEAFHQAQLLYRQRIQQLEEKGAALSSPSPSPTASPSTSLPHLRQQRAGALFGLALTFEKLHRPADALAFYREAVAEAALGYGPRTVNVGEGHVALGRLMLEEAEAEGKTEEQRAAAKQRAGEELLAALDIFGENKAPQLLDALRLYMRSLGFSPENIEELVKAQLKGGAAVNS